MRSLHAELAAVPDFRRAQGRKHAVACVLAVHVLAELANMKGCLAAAQFARSLSQEELAAVGAWRNPKTGLREPVSKSTIHRVVQSVDPEALEDVVGRWSRPRLPLARALAADGKRIRGASRNGDGHHETAALVDHATGAPFALLNFGDEGGELAATHDLLERSDVRGKVITLDALHTTRKTAKMVTGRCGADYVFSVKGNAPETFGILDGIDWERDATGRFAEDLEKAHGRLEQRSISVLTPLKRLINYPGVSQIARITRYREPLKKDGDAGKDCTEIAYVITSLDAEAASPEELLKLNRGHWSVENLNHRQRDCVFGEDACLTRTGNGPANRASLNSIALAVVFASRREAESLAEDPATPAAEPQRGHRRPDPALRAGPRPGRLPDAAGRPPSPENESPRDRNRRPRRRADGSANPESGRNAPVRPPFGGKSENRQQRGKVLTSQVRRCV